MGMPSAAAEQLAKAPPKKAAKALPAPAKENPQEESKATVAETVAIKRSSSLKRKRGGWVNNW
jgi:hypothetical protein